MNCFYSCEKWIRRISYCSLAGWFCLLMLTTIADAQQSAAPFYQSAGTKKMAALLAETFAKTDWRIDPNKADQQAAYYRKLLATRKLRPADQVLVGNEMAEQQLRAGDSAGAVATLETMLADPELKDAIHAPPFDTKIHLSLAMAYLRLGEQENCAAMHSQKSCIFPIHGSGVHQLPRGAEGAVREFSILLEKNPNDFEARWLLNVAYMQLGRYPQDVPKQWLVKEDLFRSEADLGDFLDVAPQAGLAVTGHSGGAILEDFDGDGLLDVMVSSSGPNDQLHFFHNNGDATFTDRTRAAGLTGETGGLNLVVTDYNNDGYPDVLVLRGGWWGKYGAYPMSLLKNNGNGTFDDVTEAAGLLSLHPTQTAAWADYDNDGSLDLFVGHESSADDPHPSQLFHNNGNGTFTDVAAASGISSLGFVKGVAWGDFNKDGRPDLYVSVMYGHNHLLRNDGPDKRAGAWKFTDVAQQAGVAQQSNSFATWFFDYDNDGWPDIFSAGYSTHSMQDVGAFELNQPFHAETPRLYRNNHDGTFTDVAKQTHLDRAIMVMGANFGDLDNDGWLDVYLGTGESSYEALLPNRMFRNADGKSFQDVTTSGGFGHLQKGHAIAFADIENNGCEDVFEEMGGAFPGDLYQSVLYKNPSCKNHWISLELEGTKSNRPAFGAIIAVSVIDAGRERTMYRTVGYASSFGGNPLRHHIGIGQAARVKSIEVRWPSGVVQVFKNVAVNQRLRLREGDAGLTPVHLLPFTISTRAAFSMKMPMSR